MVKRLSVGFGYMLLVKLSGVPDVIDYMFVVLSKMWLPFCRQPDEAVLANFTRKPESNLL